MAALSRFRFLAAVVLAAALAATATAPTGEAGVSVPQSRQELELSYAPLVKVAAPAVVNIYAQRIVRERVSPPLFRDPFFERFFGNRLFGQMPRERVENSLGSGVIVDSDGIIVTNNHVIEGAQEITVALADRREFPAEVILTDERTDLAVLRINSEGRPLPYLRFRDSDSIEVGDIVLAIGNPFGVGQTVTSGIVSATARTHVGVSDYQFFIQTDAAINPGNSGGALITTDGRLVGINSAIFSRTGGSIGIGFAIPSNMVRQVVDAARDGGNVIRPWLGASGQPVTSEIAESLGLDRPGGVLVRELHPKSPAKLAGLQVGDVILSIDGFEVFDPQGLRYRIGTGQIGSRVSLDVFRKGARHKIVVPLEVAPEDPPRNLKTLRGSHPLSGVTVGNLSPAFAEELGIEENATGVIIVEIPRRSPGARYLRPGDIVAAVNGREVGLVRDLERALADRRGEWLLALRRNGRTIELRVSG